MNKGCRGPRECVRVNATFTHSVEFLIAKFTLKCRKFNYFFKKCPQIP